MPRGCDAMLTPKIIELRMLCNLCRPMSATEITAKMLVNFYFT